jgi:3-deoxy-manno-octulosonate cytidylyltransferase (CMP-KDO synthetase)
MIRHVLERAKQARSLSRVLVATDDERIAEAVRSAGGEARMTPSELPSGTDRMAAVARGMDANIFVNIQGDEPLLEPSEIDSVVRILADDPAASVGTLVKRVTTEEELTSPNTVKVALDESGYALYFSRSPIPYVRGGSSPSEWLARARFYKHIGIYSFRRDFLLQYAHWPPSALECAEKLEQLRVLEKGFRIKTAETALEPMCVDTPEDAEAVRRILSIRQQPQVP